jgi:DNA-binding response OmpR family regulator
MTMTTKLNRILIIEDDPGVRKYLTRFAELAGWEATSAGNASQALKIFSVGRFSLVLVDINLNDAAMDGIAVAKKIRELEPGLRVVLMSGDPANKDKVKQAGLGPFLSKPIEPGAMAKFLERNRSRREDGPSPEKPNCILLVEDDPSIRELIAYYINTVGWKVVAVPNASEAMRIFEANKFSLLLSDVMLHDVMDGIDLAKKLKELKSDLRVILFSGIPENADRAKEAGIGIFLPKPVDLYALSNLLAD